MATKTARSNAMPLCLLTDMIGTVDSYVSVSHYSQHVTQQVPSGVMPIKAIPQMTASERNCHEAYFLLVPYVEGDLPSRILRVEYYFWKKCSNEKRRILPFPILG